NSFQQLCVLAMERTFNLHCCRFTWGPLNLAICCCLFQITGFIPRLDLCNSYWHLSLLAFFTSRRGNLRCSMLLPFCTNCFKISKHCCRNLDSGSLKVLAKMLK